MGSLNFPNLLNCLVKYFQDVTQRLLLGIITLTVMLLEQCPHCLLILHYPFGNENNLMLNGSYAIKLSEKNLLEIVNQNKQKCEPNTNLNGINL